MERLGEVAVSETFVRPVWVQVVRLSDHSAMRMTSSAPRRRSMVKMPVDGSKVGDVPSRA